MAAAAGLHRAFVHQPHESVVRRVCVCFSFVSFVVFFVILSLRSAVLHSSVRAQIVDGSLSVVFSRVFLLVLRFDLECVLSYLCDHHNITHDARICGVLYSTHAHRNICTLVCVLSCAFVRVLCEQHIAIHTLTHSHILTLNTTAARAL